MAQTKSSNSKQSSSSRSRSSQSKGSQSRSSGSKASSRSGNSTKAKSSSSRSRSGGSKSQSAKRGGGSQTTAQQRASQNGGSVIEKAKVPAAAVGAGLLAVAGGIAVAKGAGGKGSGVLPGGRGPKVNMPKPKQVGKSISKHMPKPDLKKAQSAIRDIDLPKTNGSTIGWVEEKARGVGDAGYRVAGLASEARRIQKATKDE